MKCRLVLLKGGWAEPVWMGVESCLVKQSITSSHLASSHIFQFTSCVSITVTVHFFVFSSYFLVAFRFLVDVYAVSIQVSGSGLAGFLSGIAVKSLRPNLESS